MHSPTNDAPEFDASGTDASEIGSRKALSPFAESDKRHPLAEPAKPMDDRLANLSPAQRELLRRRLSQRQAKPKPQSHADDPNVVAPIAVIGMGCRFPGAATPDQFWDLIASGREAVGPIPTDRWSRDQFFDPTGRSPGKMSVDAIGAIDGVDQFDPAFFGIAPREAARMDPQQRLLLEVVWETFENAGIPIDSAAGTETGVFIGIGGTDYSKVPSRYPNYFDHIDAHVGTGNALSIAAGRISYLFDFRGPSYIVDTACSSALVAIDNACTALAAGTCDAAVTGGVNLILSPETTIAFSKARMLSPDGHCRPFDDGANGYVRGEGCGIVLLKRLADARRDGDKILGVIRGTAVNQDGRTSGITAPSGQAQQKVIAAALAKAKCVIDDITYIEAHGTGTPLGDPIELSALAEMFSRRATHLPPIRFGSVKANIGHTETASGIAGLIKVLLMMQRGVIPAQANFHRLNSNVRLSPKTMSVADVTSDWTPSQDGRRIAGVSSFGFGGTNAHLVVESAGAMPLPTVAPEIPTSIAPALVLPISAADDGALKASAISYAELLSGKSRRQVADICGTAATDRTALGKRIAIVADDPDSMIEQLRRLAAGDEIDIAGRRPAGRRQRIAMLFTGQGSQYAAMGARLAKTMPVFADALESCAACIDDELPAPLRTILSGDTKSLGGRTIDHTSLAQVAITAIQCSLVDTLRHFGITPDVVAGHSVGEIAALYAAGALTRDDALRIATHRGRQMGKLPDGGAMAAILASAETVAELIESANSSATVATMNGPSNTVVAGTINEVEKLIEAASSAGHVCKKLLVSHAFHSPLMQPAAEHLREHLTSFLRPATVPRHITFISSVTGRRHDSPIGVDYWIDHLLHPVRFTDVIDQLRGEKIDLAVEIGPTPQLCGMIRHADRAQQQRDADAKPIRCVPTLAPERDDYAGWIKSLAELWCVGVAVDWNKLGRIYPTRRVSLPNYPFQRSRFWYDPPGIGNHGVGNQIGSPAGYVAHPLLGSKTALADGRTLFTNVIRKSEPNFIADHVVAGSVIVPAAAWIETLRAAGAAALGESIEMRDVTIDRALFLDDDASVTLQISVKPGTSRCEITIDAKTASDDSAWQRCGSATAIKTDGPAPVQSLVSPATESKKIDRDELYDRLANSQLEYGRYFQTLHDIQRAGNIATATLRIDDDLSTDSHRYRWHPTLLDGAFQSIATIANVDDQTYLPVGIRRIDLHGDHPIASVTATMIASDSPDELVADVVCGDATGNPVATFTGLRLKSLKRSRGKAQLDTARWFHAVSWVAQVVGPSGPDGALHDDRTAELFGLATACRGYEDDDAISHVQSLCRTIQSAIATEPTPRLTIVTRGGYSITSDDKPDPTAAAIIAFARVAANEYPSLGIRILDLPNFDADSLAAMEAFAAMASDETEAAYRDHQWLHPRLTAQPRQFTASPPDAETALPVSGSYRMRLDGTHRIEGLWAQRIVAPPANRGEVTLSIDVAALNFSDVLKTMGLYPGIKDDVTPLGIEVCGHVTELGEDVDRFRIGDRVMGVVPHGFATDDATNDYLLMRVPDGITSAEAASLPIAFATAHHALINVGRLRRGESVLIHAGAGGVGLAAVQVAKSIGAVVYTTAGNHVKRSLIAELGVPAENILDSRDVRSMEHLRVATDGRGVDVVLNSLPGEWIDESLKMLAPYGRFLEIGKTDIYQNRAIGLLPFQDNLSYSAIDLDRMFRDRGDEVRELFDAVAAKFEAGVYRPLPMTMFGFDELPAAIKFMAARRNIGKVVVTLPPKKADVAKRFGKVVMITGGSGAIAHQIAKRMIQRGARAVALVARSEPSETVKALQSWAAEQNATIQYFRGDCADEPSMSACVADINATLGPITGVIHAAGVLDDRLLHEMTDESIERVMRPKVVGAVVLAEVTANQPVEAFHLVGSVASVFGSPGQANYAAANGFLEGFSSALRRQGKPASVVHWGPWATAGMADDPLRLKNLASRGLTPLVAENAVDVLIDACDFVDVERTPIVVDADFVMMTSGAGKNLPSMMRGFGGQAGASGSPTSRKDAAFLSGLIELDADATINALSGYFANQLGKIMSISADAIDPHQPLGVLGLDSLMAIELKNTIETKLDVQIPISKFISDPTLASLAEATAELI